jgi:hypothetical protein
MYSSRLRPMGGQRVKPAMARIARDYGYTLAELRKL